MEILEDPGFDDPSKWDETPANTWTVANSKATCNAAGACYTPGFTQLDHTYDISIIIDPGAVFVGRGLVLRASYDQEVEFTTAGVHTMTMVADGSNTYIILDSVDESGTPSFSGSVSNLSVKKHQV